MSRARIVTVGHAVPKRRGQPELWEEYFADYYANNRLARTVFRRSGVQYRHGVVDPLEEDISELSTSNRMSRYAEHGPPLAAAAVEKSLARAGRGPEEVGRLILVTCTGYVAPGADLLLADELGMSASLERMTLGHMGCYAALPALTTVADGVAARGGISVVVSLELTSLHVQPREEPMNREQLVSHALFGDAAAAAVMVPADARNEDSGKGFEFVDSAVLTDTTGLGEMSWRVTDQGFRMGLSPKVPEFLGRHVAGLVTGLLGRNGLTPEEVAAWAIHPGGPEIIDVVAGRLTLDEETVAPSRRVLAGYGNCSSATVLLILEEIISDEGVAAGGPVVALAFGPGLTLHAVLLRKAGP